MTKPVEASFSTFLKEVGKSGKPFDFGAQVKFLQTISTSLLATDRINLAGYGNVAMLNAKGADDLAQNLLTTAEWLVRLEQFLNCKSGCSEIPTMTEGVFDPPKE